MIEILINTIKHTNRAMAITQLFVHLNPRNIDAKKKIVYKCPITTKFTLDFGQTTVQNTGNQLVHLNFFFHQNKSNMIRK